MKIAFLTPEYPLPRFGNSGGIGTSILNLAKGLVAEGNDVSILVYGQKEDYLFEEEGIVFYSIKNIKFKGFSWYFTRKKIEKLLNKLHKENNIEIVEAPDWTGITSFIKTSCPLVIRENGSDTYFCHLDERKVKFKNYFHEKRALKKATAIISVSEFTGNLTNTLFGLKRRFSVIPNSIDTNFFKPEDQKSNDTILYFGSLIRKKGLLELPFIFNKVVESNPNAKLILVGKDVPDIISGNSSTWAMMRSLFSEKALANTNYVGSVDYAQIKKHIDDATICVFPSFAEALPVSWLEAMALEKAVVASNVGWANEIIDDGVDGFLVNPKDHSVYATKISQLLDDTDLRSSFEKNARKKSIDRFDLKVVVEKNVAFYRSIIEK